MKFSIHGKDNENLKYNSAILKILNQLKKITKGYTC